MENAPARSGSRSASRKSSAVVVIAQNDIAEIKVRKQSSNLLAQQLQHQLLLQQQQQQLRSVRRDQVFCLHPFGQWRFKVGALWADLARGPNI